MRGEFVSLNGEILPAGDAQVSVFDAGLTHGAGLFETLRAFHGRPFRLERHLDRLEASAKALHVPLPDDRESWGRDIERLLEANGLREARLRLTVTPGATQGAAAESEEPGFHGTTLITASAAAAYPAELYARGMTVCVSSFRVSKLDPIARHKTVSYLPRLIALREAQQKRCGEALWFNTENLLAEGCISNVFLVIGGALHTPRLDTPVLPGVTRGLVAEMSQGHGIEMRETPLTIDDLLGATEIFLTNAVMGIMPVTRIERHAVGNEKPGGVTVQMMQEYRAFVERETASEEE